MANNKLVNYLNAKASEQTYSMAINPNKKFELVKKDIQNDPNFKFLPQTIKKELVSGEMISAFGLAMKYKNNVRNQVFNFGLNNAHDQIIANKDFSQLPEKMQESVLNYGKEYEKFAKAQIFADSAQGNIKMPTFNIKLGQTNIIADLGEQYCKEINTTEESITLSSESSIDLEK